MWYEDEIALMQSRQELQLLRIRIRHCAARTWLARKYGMEMKRSAEEARMAHLQTELAELVKASTRQQTPRTETPSHSGTGSDSGYAPGSSTSAEPSPEPEAPRTTAP